MNATAAGSMLLRRARLLVLLAAVSLMALACDDGDEPGEIDDTSVADTAVDTSSDDTADTGTPDDTTEDSTEDDTTAPELRDVRVTVPTARGGDSTLDLNAGDARRTVPAEVEVSFKVFARDDISAADALTVTAATPDGTPLESASAGEIVNGLWEFTATVAPGDTVHIQVTDEAGNTTLSQYALVMVAHADAIVGSWSTRYYNDAQEVTATSTATYADDGTWTSTDERSGITRTGTWALEGQDLVLEERTSTETDADTDPDTIERRTVGRYYIDQTHFSTRALTAEGATDGAQGTWTATVTLEEADDTGTLGAPITGTRTLVLADDATFTDTLDTGATQTVVEGTWLVEISEDYEESFGDFLVREIATINGNPPPEPTTETELHKATANYLLISPAVRAE